MSGEETFVKEDIPSPRMIRREKKEAAKAARRGTPAPVPEPAPEVPPEAPPEPTPVPAPEPTPEPEPPQEEVSVHGERGTFDVDVMRKYVTVAKTKDSVPSLICIDKEYYKRYFILDVEGDGCRMAWEYYKSTQIDPTPEEFVSIMTRILSLDMPRMHRTVSFVPLV